MFTSDFKEKLIGEVHFPNKKYDDIIEMLNVIYPHKTDEIDGNLYLCVNQLN
jgi:hypothetical protein